MENEPALQDMYKLGRTLVQARVTADGLGLNRTGLALDMTLRALDREIDKQHRKIRRAIERPKGKG